MVHVMAIGAVGVEKAGAGFQVHVLEEGRQIHGAWCHVGLDVRLLPEGGW